MYRGTGSGVGAGEGPGGRAKKRGVGRTAVGAFGAAQLAAAATSPECSSRSLIVRAQVCVKGKESACARILWARVRVRSYVRSVARVCTICHVLHLRLLWRLCGRVDRVSPNDRLHVHATCNVHHTADNMQRAARMLPAQKWAARLRRLHFHCCSHRLGGWMTCSMAAARTFMSPTEHGQLSWRSSHCPAEDTVRPSTLLRPKATRRSRTIGCDPLSGRTAGRLWPQQRC
jgi:hypothetical protein